MDPGLLSSLFLSETAGYSTTAMWTGNSIDKFLVSLKSMEFQGHTFKMFGWLLPQFSPILVDRISGMLTIDYTCFGANEI